LLRVGDRGTCKEVDGLIKRLEQEIEVHLRDDCVWGVRKQRTWKQRTRNQRTRNLLLNCSKIVSSKHCVGSNHKTTNCTLARNKLVLIAGEMVTSLNIEAAPQPRLTFASAPTSPRSILIGPSQPWIHKNPKSRVNLRRHLLQALTGKNI
jgi:hypothetical protein